MWMIQIIDETGCTCIHVYLLHFHAHVINNCIFEKDHLKVINMCDAMFTETPQHLFPAMSLQFSLDASKSRNISGSCSVHMVSDKVWVGREMA